MPRAFSVFVTRRPRIRALLIISLFVAGGACDASLSQGADEDRSPTGDGDFDEASACVVDTDCVLQASSCCSCPTFAVATSAGGSCDGVQCPAEPECAPAAAACDDDGQCALVCAPVTTTQQCEAGFVVDEAGCTLDECAAALAPECVEDIDCVVVPADCCGCELGGNDTAVPQTEEADHLGSLSCGDGPVSCPGISSCEPGSEAACLGGRCRYLEGPGTDAPLPLCGTLETGGCQAGDVCVLNGGLEDGSIPGIGVCRPE